MKELWILLSRVEPNGIYSIGTHGCVKRAEDKILFKKGLEKCLKIKPKKIIVHGTMPEEIFGEFIADYEFILYESYIEKIKRKGV